MQKSEILKRVDKRMFRKHPGNWCEIESDDRKNFLFHKLKETCCVKNHDPSVVFFRGTTMFSRIVEGMALKCLRRTSPSSTFFNTISRCLAVTLQNIRGRSSLSQCTSSLVLKKGKLSWMVLRACPSLIRLRHRAQSISEILDKVKTHAFPDENIITDGAKRFRCVEMLFQPVSLAADFTAPLHHEG